MRWYSPSAGRWFSRDPAGEPGFEALQGGAARLMTHTSAASSTRPRWFSRNAVGRGEWSPYGFVMNSPIDSFDILGLVAGGGSMQMNCRQPCEDYKRSHYADMDPGDIPNGAIVCCGGAKFICTWGADKEKNQRAKEIAKKCLTAHEHVHLPSVTCDECATGPTAVKWKKSGKAACEEEVTAHGVSKSCFENALSQCGSDQQCIDDVNAWIQQEAAAIDLYQKLCKQFK